MGISRRQFLVGLGLFAAGCANDNHVSERPSPDWPTESSRYYSGGPGPGGQPPTPAMPPGGYSASPYVPLPNMPPVPDGMRRNLEAEPLAVPATPGGGLRAIPRSRWADAGPDMNRIHPMDGVSRITIHHEGWKVVSFVDAATTAQRIELDRRSHLVRLGAGDLAYHYVIDRAGRLWQGRDIRYQGAHVSGENEHNAGVMVLGNFDLQYPSDAQLSTLHRTVATLMHQYHVPTSRVFTHRELRPTECPGTALQPRVAAMRTRSFA